jgi:methionyl-tRNA synthetase
VCATDLVEAGASSDALRYFLAKVNPEKGKRSFEPAEFIALHNQGCQELGARIERALADACRGAVGALPAVLASQLEELYRVQALGLAFPVPNLEQAVTVVDAWRLVGARLDGAAASSPDQAATQAYWWLKGLALLAWPFMPRTAAQIWRRLGHTGEPPPAGFT